MSRQPANPSYITRREALSRIAVMLGGTIVGAEFLLNGTRLEAKVSGPDFTTGQLALMDEIADTIIPTTDTPGAKAAGVGAFMALIVKDCYSTDEEAKFRRGLADIDAASVRKFGKGFMAATPAERTALLTEFDGQERKSRGPGRAPGAFGLIKQLSVVGYFTSEIGCTQALRFQESPGFFVGCAPFGKDDRDWFTTVGRAIDAGNA